MILECVIQTTGISRTRYSDILVYPTYYHVTNLVGLTDSDCITVAKYIRSVAKLFKL